MIQRQLLRDLSALPAVVVFQDVLRVLSVLERILSPQHDRRPSRLFNDDSRRLLYGLRSILVHLPPLGYAASLNGCPFKSSALINNVKVVFRFVLFSVTLEHFPPLSRARCFRRVTGHRAALVFFHSLTFDSLTFRLRIVVVLYNFFLLTNLFDSRRRLRHRSFGLVYAV